MLCSHYEIIKKLGEGGFGATYLAQDTHLPDRPYRVVKHLKNQNTTVFTEAKRLFEREAKILYGLKHPQIPRLYAYFEEKGKFYLVQEYIEGHDLSLEIVAEKPWGFVTLVLLKLYKLFVRIQVCKMSIYPYECHSPRGRSL